jgi:hypothetical protein
VIITLETEPKCDSHAILEKADMRIMLDLPEDIAADLAAKGEDLSRAALEAFALQEYRAQKLSTAQLRRLLGLQTRMQVHAFLKANGVYFHYSVADLEHDRQAGNALPR